MKIKDFHLFYLAIFLFELVSESHQTFRTERNNFPNKFPQPRHFRQNVKMIPLTRKMKRKSRSFLSDAKKGKPPKFKFIWDDPEVQVVHRYAAMTAELNCTVKAWPKPDVTWFRNGVEVNSKNDRP